MNAYILRSKPNGINRESEFLGGRVSIGWPCGESLSGKDRDDISIILTKRYSDISEISVSMVKLFVQMPVGSIVLTPSLQDKSLIHILRTNSTYKYDHLSEANGNPHFIQAEYLKTVPRSKLPKAVIRSLSGARKTFSRISQHFDLLDEFIGSGFEADIEIPPALIGSKAEAINVLYDLLSSENEKIRLQAAVAIMELG